MFKNPEIMNTKFFIYGATLALLNFNICVAKTKVSLQKAFDKKYVTAKAIYKKHSIKSILQPKLFVKVV